MSANGAPLPLLLKRVAVARYSRKIWVLRMSSIPS